MSSPPLFFLPLSCRCLFVAAVSVSSVLQDNASRLRLLCVCVSVCVTVFDVPECLALHILLFQAVAPDHVCVCVCGGLEGGVCLCVCVNWYILDTRLIITQTAAPLQGQDGGYFKIRVCVSGS